MVEEIRLTKTVVNRTEFTTAVDTSFKTFTRPAVSQDTDTVEELFRLYDKLYFSIPVRGVSNSHEYLVTRSSEVFSIEEKSAEIQPLLDEIAQLRQELLQANQEIVNLNTQVVQQPRQ